jgi:cellulose synthase/poly-beta-1,6-N-acetylglucosamine synthase-like glycosyltransferase
LHKLKIRRLIRSGKISAKYEPLVSIVIPAWNEEVGILTTIKSALSNSYKNCELIVVDDGSTDSTAKIVNGFIAKYKKNPLNSKIIKFYTKQNGGKASAMNFGLTKVRGEIIVTMDADSAHHPKAVENMVEYFKDPDVNALVGNVKVSNTQTIVGLVQKLEYIFGFYFKRVHSMFDSEYIFGGACAAFRKSTTFDVLGGFDTTNKTEDIELSMRIKFNGLKAVYAENVLAYTEGASTLSGLYKQRLRWKKGRIDTFVKYRKLFLSRHKAHPKFLSWIVLPYAVIGEVQLLFEPLFFTLIWTYTLVSGDYLSIGISSLFILFTFFSASLFGDKHTSKLTILYFPAFWLLFYILVAIEFLALVKSIDLYIEKKDADWQRWERKGIASSIDLGVQ